MSQTQRIFFTQQTKILFCHKKKQIFFCQKNTKLSCHKKKTFCVAKAVNFLSQKQKKTFLNITTKNFFRHKKNNCHNNIFFVLKKFMFMVTKQQITFVNKKKIVRIITFSCHKNKELVLSRIFLKNFFLSQKQITFFLKKQRNFLVT